MIYDTSSKNWTKGPTLNIERIHHACMVDLKTETIHVMGGYDKSNHIETYSTETLKKGSKKWKMGPNLKESSSKHAAVSSRSDEYVGYLVGGWLDDGNHAKTYGLRRHDMEWIEMSKQPKIPRAAHTIVNPSLVEIGC